MAGVIWLILRVLLLLLAVLVLAAVLLLSVRAGVEAVGVDGAVSVELRWGVLRLPVYPLPAKKKSGPAQKKRQTTPQKPKKTFSLNREALDIGELADTVLTLLDELTDTLRISRLRVRVLIGTEDAAKTGLLLGYASTFTGMVVPFLENTFEMKDYRVRIDADFDATETKWAFTVFCSLRPIRLVGVLLRHGREYYRLYKRLIKKEEAIEHE